MHKYFIYGLFRNDILFYVGVTRNKKQRLSSHKVTYGIDIFMQILDEYYGSEDTALALESFWIKKYRDLGFELNNIQNHKPQRINRCYKCSDEVYLMAMARAKKEGTTVAELVENWVKLYGQGYCVGLIESRGGEVNIDVPKWIKDHNKQL